MNNMQSVKQSKQVTFCLHVINRVPWLSYIKELKLEQQCLKVLEKEKL